jgi:uncharacterized protein YkwD
MIHFLSHFFLPQESNNYRAKLLHHNILLLFIGLILASTFTLDIVKVNFPSVLGIQTNITVDQLLSLTNEKRKDFGLPALSLNDQLSNAAALKAQDMFEKDYWAHNSPDGKTPWFFIKQTGYNYTYAGENLAKGFNSAEEAVSAWMASVKHRDNMLFKNYSEVGFSVATGKLNGQDTVLIVQEFGNPVRAAIAQDKEVKQPISSSGGEISPKLSIATSSPTNDIVIPRVFAGATNDNKPILNSLSFSLNMERVLLALFIFVLILDVVVVERRRIIRLVGHSPDHILFLAMVVLIATIFSRGGVL